MKRNIVISIIMFISIATSLYPAMYANGSECYFIPNLCNNSSVSIPYDLPKTDNILDGLIIDGAESFFEATSHYWSYVKEFEVGNFEGMQTNLDRAIDSIKTANSIYTELHQKSLLYQHDEAVRIKLITFDYDNFQQAFGLIPSVFLKVKSYLVNGDVRGTYKEIERMTGELAADMEALQSQESQPKRSVWRISQKVTETVLFGQYIAEVFEQVI